MHRALLLVVVMGGIAEARPEPPPAEAPVESKFWRDIVEPHADHVRMLVSKARAALHNVDSAVANSDTDWAVDQKRRLYRDAYNLLRYAKKLAPQDPEVLALFGRAADELGETRAAIEALEACIELDGPVAAGPEVTGRLGAIYLRMGKRDTAIRWLRYAQGPSPASAPALVHLANALAARGQVIAAIDTLANEIPSTPVPSPFHDDRDALLMFALAVIYDRDEQRGAAFEMLERMQSTMQQRYATTIRNELARMRFAPAEDQHYYLALLYESLGYEIEARAEWAHYAAIPDAPWRRRALAHIAELDRQRRTAPRARRTLVPAPTLYVPGSRHP